MSFVPTRLAYPFRHATDLPQAAWRALLQNEAAANVILPFAKKAQSFPNGNTTEQLWIVLYDDANNVAFVLSCTKGPLGNYPIFIVDCRTAAQITREERSGRSLSDSLRPLVVCLLQHVPPQRVFSVFSTAKVTMKFAEVFEAHTPQAYGIRAYADPYYDATFTFCTRETLRKSSEAVSPFPGGNNVAIKLCLADMSHLNELKAMCLAFSETSPPFVLDDTGAEMEAKLLIRNQQVWVHLVQRSGQAAEIACLVATTRESDNVTAVTKVFTAEHWRGHGCAARLLHRVCQEILQKKKRVVLYVGNSDELAPARRVYHKVGFQGLGGPHPPPPGVERWLEIGFNNTALGYW